MYRKASTENRLVRPHGMKNASHFLLHSEVKQNSAIIFRNILQLQNKAVRNAAQLQTTKEIDSSKYFDDPPKKPKYSDEINLQFKALSLFRKLLFLLLKKFLITN